MKRKEKKMISQHLTDVPAVNASLKEMFTEMAIIGDMELRRGEFYIPICRFRCLACKVTISILPSFLIPYFQHTLDSMVGRLSSALKGEKVKGSRQQLEQHMKRFY